MNNQSYAIGIDIGGTTTKFGVVNHRGTITYTGSISTSQYPTAEYFVEALQQALMPTINKVGIENIKGIGIGAPNGNYYTGSVDYAPNLPWRGEYLYRK
jgi:glucokinase